MFDVTKLRNLEKTLKKRIKDIQHQNRSDATQFPIVLLINKVDLIEKISPGEMQRIDEAVRELHLCGWFEVSAKSGANINVAYQFLAIRMMEADDFSNPEEATQCNPGTPFELCACS